MDQIQHSKPVPPFVKFCAANIPMVFDDSLSYYECLCALWKWLQTDVIDVINNNATVTQKWREELTEFEGNVTDEIEEFESDMRSDFSDLNEAFNTLKSWIDNYFDNLDVQEEINNKLDQMAEDGELENIIRLYINKQVEYIFPKFWADQYSQDCTIIKGYDKNIAIDCGRESNWTNIQEMFSDNEVEKLDYFILSHYDSDHVGNLNNLIINGIIDSNTIVYLPVVPDRYPSAQVTETTVKTTLNNIGITFVTPSEGEKLEINSDFDITFGNLNKTYMEDNYGDYNYCSMVCLVRHRDTTAFFAGDAGTPTFKYLSNIKFITSTVDLYKQAHHGIDLNTYPEFFKQIKPTNVVQEGGVKDFGRGIYQSGETSLLVSMGCNYYATYMSDDYVRFASTGYSMVNKYGFNGAYSCTGQNLTLYVDANASSEHIQNGSEDYPFEDLNQAFGYIYNYPTARVTINLADGNYNVETAEVDNLISLHDCNIIVNGNSSDDTAVKLEGIWLRNMNITFNHLTFKSSNDPIIRVEHCHCSLINVTITNDTVVSRGIVITKGSTLSLESVTFNNINTCIAGYECSSVAYNGTNDFGNCTQIEDNNTGLIGNKAEHLLPFTKSNNGYTCKVNLTGYSQLKVYASVAAAPYKQTVVTINNPTNGQNYSGVINEYIYTSGNEHLTMNYFELRLRSNKILYMDGERVISIANGTNPNITNGTPDTIVIDKIIGIS